MSFAAAADVNGEARHPSSASKPEAMLRPAGHAGPGRCVSWLLSPAAGQSGCRYRPAASE